MEVNMSKTTSLKTLAMKAKQRMNENCSNTKNYGKNIKIISDKPKEELYVKVCAVLTRDRDTATPLGELIDKKLYNSLDKFAREKYFFEIAEMYLELKKRFEREHPSVI